MAIWEEMDGSPTETRAEDGSFSTVMKMICDWTDRHEVEDRFVAYQTPYLHFTERFGFPNHGVVALSSSVKPLGGAKITEGTADGWGIASYEKAIVTVKFGVPSGPNARFVSDDPIRGRGDSISESIEPNLEFQTLDPSGFEWESDGAKLKEKEAPGRLEVGFDYVFTRHRVSAVPPGAFSLAGHVNKTTLRSLSPLLVGREFLPGTLLYVKPSFRHEIDTTGNSIISVTYRFSFRPSGWNQFWRNDRPTVPQDGESIVRVGGYDKLRARKTPQNAGVPDADRIYNNYPIGELVVL